MVTSLSRSQEWHTESSRGPERVLSLRREVLASLAGQTRLQYSDTHVILLLGQQQVCACAPHHHARVRVRVYPRAHAQRRRTYVDATRTRARDRDRAIAWRRRVNNHSCSSCKESAGVFSLSLSDCCCSLLIQKTAKLIKMLHRFRYAKCNYVHKTLNKRVHN